MKRLIYFFYFLFSFPALLLHEMTHIIIALLFFKKVYNVDFKFKDKDKFHYSITVNTNVSRYKITEIFISLSPMITLMVMYILSYLYPIVGFIFIPYSIIYMKSILPSDLDYENIKNYKNFDTEIENNLFIILKDL